MTQLALKTVSLAFGGVQAVGEVTMAVEAGAIHGLIGPNGAGKTTLINLITGLMRPDAGTITFDGRRIDGQPSYRIARRGLRRTFQNLRIFPRLSVLDHAIIAQHAIRRDLTLRRLWFSPASRREESEATGRAYRALDRVGIGGRAHERAADLPYGDQRRLEIASALVSEPKLVLLDEPTAGMNPAESDRMAELIRSIAAEGRTVVLVEHNMGLVMQVCHQITVLDFGRVIAEGTPEEVHADPTVIEAYLGREEEA